MQYVACFSISLKEILTHLKKKKAKNTTFFLKKGRVMRVCSFFRECMCGILYLWGEDFFEMGGGI